MTTHHKVGKSEALVLKKDGEWTQIRILPSAWEDCYHVITEELIGKPANSQISEYRRMTQAEIIAEYGEIDELAELSGWHTLGEKI